MAFVTLLMAGAYWWASDFAVNGGERWGLAWDGVLRINSARVFLTALMPGQATMDRASPPMGGLSLFGARPQRMTPQQRQMQLRVRGEIAAVEMVAHAWQQVMWGLAAALALVAILSWVTRWGRLWHFLGAVAILSVTTATLIAVRYLDIPDGSNLSIWPLSVERYHALLDHLAETARAKGQELDSVPTGGGMGNPPLAAKTYVLLGAGLSAYGWCLLIVFARRHKRAPAPDVLPDGPL